MNDPGKRHTCTYLNENEWWPSKAEKYKPSSQLSTITTCNIVLRKREISELEIPFEKMIKRDQILKMKFFIEDNVMNMSTYLLYQPNRFNEYQRFAQVEPTEVILFHMNHLSHLEMSRLTNLLKKQIVFTNHETRHETKEESSQTESSTPRTWTPTASTSPTTFKAFKCNKCTGYDWSQPRAMSHFWHPNYCPFCLEKARKIANDHQCAIHQNTNCIDGQCPICQTSCGTCQNPVEGNFRSALIHSCGLCSEKFLKYPNMIEYICEKCVESFTST